ncbi:helix-turn-helix domain-containing protein [Chondrinema litorale]|uniref:helix-turn-helix domain-containing protein n=1 Tax=Chondrinema litorale TaxID=2994555 RepID=UPI0025438EF9|nr:AraC family transcriptional regulator [Chondrinema litorale]UZR94724.1 AraC family transcriptional regulator [Chondrinema litorale]
MIVIPQKLFNDTQVSIILRDGNICVLQKELPVSVKQREGYVASHAISFVQSGEQIINFYNGEEVRIKAKELVIIPRGVYYISDLISSGEQFKSLLFYFDDDIIHQFLSSLNHSEYQRKATSQHLLINNSPNLNTFCTSLISIYKNSSYQQSALAAIKILELLHLLHQNNKDLIAFLFQLTLPQKRNIKSFMQKNFDKPLKIEDYAYLTGRSESTFRRDFKSAFEITPQKWLKVKRIEKALSILKNKEISVTELAFEVGYENISYFIKEFKKETGETPKQYILSKHKNHLQL